MFELLELSQNQVTHFYSTRKDTAEMVRMMDVLRAQYRHGRVIYLSWDAASWHVSKDFDAEVAVRHQAAKADGLPFVKTAPLPESTQRMEFLRTTGVPLVKWGMSFPKLHCRMSCDSPFIVVV